MSPEQISVLIGQDPQSGTQFRFAVCDVLEQLLTMLVNFPRQRIHTGSTPWRLEGCVSGRQACARASTRSVASEGRGLQAAIHTASDRDSCTRSHKSRCRANYSQNSNLHHVVKLATEAIQLCVDQLLHAMLTNFAFSDAESRNKAIQIVNLVSRASSLGVYTRFVHKACSPGEVNRRQFPTSADMGGGVHFA